MSLPSIVSYGAGAKTSTLVWDSDLTIPDGYAIESASGEVGIVGDVSVSGSLSAENTVQGAEEVTSALVTATDADVTHLSVSGYDLSLITSPNQRFTINSTDIVTIPVTPNSGVSVSGELVFSTGSSTTVNVYLYCYSDSGQTNILIGTHPPSPGKAFGIKVSGIVPGGTKRVNITSTVDPSGVNLSSAVYTSRCLY